MARTRSRLLGSTLVALAATTLACGRGGGGLLGAPIGLIGLAVLAVQIWAIVEIVQSARDTVGKVVWILVVLLLPIVGVICWVLFGRR